MKILNFDIRKLLTRAATVLVFAPLIIGLALQKDQWPFFIVAFILVILGLYEMYHMYNQQYGKANHHFYIGYIISGLLVLSAYLTETRAFWHNPYMATLCLTSIILFSIELFRRKICCLQNSWAYLLRSIIYVGLLCSYIPLLRALGMYYLIFVVAIVWTNDIFAYLIGLPLGKHRLSPEVSPKKSVEGAIGAIFGALLMSTNLRGFFPHMSLLDAIVIGITLSILAQIGDLIESLLKRELNTKDSSHLVPGHGGILDRLDSFILVIPVFYYYAYYFIR